MKFTFVEDILAAEEMRFLVVLLWDQTSSCTEQQKQLEFKPGAIKTFQMVHLPSPFPPKSPLLWPGMASSV